MIPVCENGKFRGIITERDIVTGVVAAGRDPGAAPASSVMSKDLPTVSPNDDLWKAVNVMADRGIKVLPVVQDSKLVSLLSLDDLAKKNPALAAMVFSRSIKLQTRSSAFYASKR